MPAERKDLQKFLTDPAFAEDRAFLDGYLESFLERKAREAREKSEQERKKNANIFDELFGGG